MIAYKIVETDSTGKIYSLFHATNGTRVMKEGVVLKAQIREQAKDGTSKTTYKSGWHSLPTLQECEEYLSKFKNRLDKLIIVKVQVSGDVWDKNHSKANVILSSEITILSVVK